MKILETFGVKPPDGLGIVRVKNPTGLLDLYQSDDVTILQVKKEIEEDTEHWVIGEIVCSYYVGKDFETRMKNESPDTELIYTSGKLPEPTEQRKVLVGHGDYEPKLRPVRNGWLKSIRW